MLRLHRSEDVAAALARAGFRFRCLPGYQQLRFGRGWTGFLATKDHEAT